MVVSLVSHLKRAVKKVRLILLGVKLQRWRVASLLRRATTTRRRLSFNDRLGLQGCLYEDDKSGDENNDSHLRRVQSTISRSSSNDYDDDIDQKADAFIANFRRQLRLERQVSLELSYCRGSSFSS